MSQHSHRRLLNRFVNLSFAEMLSTLRAPSALAARYASTRQREGRLGLRRGRESEGPILLFVLLIDRNFLLRKKRPRFFSSGSPGPFLLLAAALAPSSRSFRGWGTTPSALDALERNERLALDDAFRKRFFFSCVGDAATSWTDGDICSLPSRRDCSLGFSCSSLRQPRLPAWEARGELCSILERISDSQGSLSTKQKKNISRSTSTSSSTSRSATTIVAGIVGPRRSSAPRRSGNDSATVTRAAGAADKLSGIVFEPFNEVRIVSSFSFFLSSQP